jgi:hypothetical protein
MLTKACKLNKLTLDLVFLTTDYILELFELIQDVYTDNPIFTLMFSSG